MTEHNRGTGIFAFPVKECGRWWVGVVLAICMANAAAQTVRWEDYRGNDRVGTVYTGPAGAPTFANNTGTGAARLNALRAIAANPANAVRTGTVADINYRQAANHLCNMDSPAASVASCSLQAMGRVSYALIQFPQAGTYGVSIAHDDNVELGFSSDYANTSYRSASYDVPVGTVNDCAMFSAIRPPMLDNGSTTSPVISAGRWVGRAVGAGGARVWRPGRLEPGAHREGSVRLSFVGRRDGHV
mgnify:CR=1 FL=1